MMYINIDGVKIAMTLHRIGAIPVCILSRDKPSNVTAIREPLKFFHEILFCLNLQNHWHNTFLKFSCS